MKFFTQIYINISTNKKLKLTNVREFLSPLRIFLLNKI